MNAGPFATLDDLIAYVDQSDPSRFFYAIIDKTRAPSPECPSGALAGLVAFCGASPSNLSIEIGPMIVLQEFQRTHVASNAIGLLLRYALDPVGKGGLGLRRAQWECASENGPSMRVAEKMGFVKEGLLRWHVVHWDGVARGKVGNRKGLPEGGVEGGLG